MGEREHGTSIHRQNAKLALGAERTNSKIIGGQAF